MGVAQAQLHAFDVFILEHLGQGDVLAKGRLEVELIALRGGELHTALALIHSGKKRVGSAMFLIRIKLNLLLCHVTNPIYLIIQQFQKECKRVSQFFQINMRLMSR